MDRLERLLTLLMVLLETPRPLSAEELRDRVAGYHGVESQTAFHRAFERDKDSLREMGVPLSVEPVPGADPPRDGYRVLPDDYYLRDPDLDADELAALHLAATTVRLDGIRSTEALWKLGGATAGAKASAPDPGGRAALPGDERLGRIFEAVTQRRRVGFRYRDKDRDLEPCRLRIDRGHWYLEARRPGEEELRSFRVDRIEGGVELGEADAFEVPAELPARIGEPWELGEGPPVRARVRIDAVQAPWARQHLGDRGVVEEVEDGDVVVTMEVVDRPAFRSFVLTFLDHAEVLEPPELRQEIVDWLEALT